MATVKKVLHLLYCTSLAKAFGTFSGSHLLLISITVPQLTMTSCLLHLFYPNLYHLSKQMCHCCMLMKPE